jgi:hypothetical protein
LLSKRKERYSPQEILDAYNIMLPTEKLLTIGFIMATLLDIVEAWLQIYVRSSSKKKEFLLVLVIKRIPQNYDTFMNVLHLLS